MQVNMQFGSLSSLSFICVKIFFYVGVCFKTDIYDKVSGLLEALKVLTRLSCPVQSLLNQGLYKVAVTAMDKKTDELCGGVCIIHMYICIYTAGELGISCLSCVVTPKLKGI